MSYLGLNKLGKVYLGTTKIAKVYLGTNLVYQKESSSALPYDAEIEYLEATGTQYIDTGLSPTTNSHVIIECSNVLNASLENESFGYGVSGGQRFHMVAVANWNSNKFHAGCGTDFIYTTAADTASHTFELYGNGTFVQDGTSYSIGSSVGTISDTMPLFARLWNGSYQYSNGVRIHSFKWYESETLVLDLIPVRVEQTGYMYDKVSGQLFGNLGTNHFTLGDDKIDTDGLIGYWNCEDAAVNGNWVDRINSFQLQLGGTAAKTSDGYRFNNLSSPRNAYALFNYNSNSTLNSLIDKTFTCIVYCSIKFTATNKTASIIDFSSLGSSFSGISILASAGQNGNVSGNFKVDGNSGSGWEEKNSPVVGNAIPTGEYVNYPIKLGTRILDNGKQEAFFEADGVRANAIKTTPVKVNFSGCATSGTGSCAFGLGITYLSGQSVTQYASNYLCDIYYRKILLYNKPK